MAELWDLFDYNLKPADEKLVRGEPMPKDRLHYVVDILPMNKDGKFLITKRHPDKTFPNMWEITGGSVIAGETPLEGALRELFEETGLKASAEDMTYMGQIIRHRSGCIHTFYLYEGDFSEKDIVLQEGETVDFKILTAEEIEKMCDNGEFLSFSFNRIRAVYADYFFKQHI